jgi:hypothetical protein
VYAAWCLSPAVALSLGVSLNRASFPGKKSTVIAPQQ